MPAFKKLLPLIVVCFTMLISEQKTYAASTNIIRVTLPGDSLKDNCADSNAIKKIIADAIELGAPVYNAGYHIGCYRIYEWAAYKILYVYGSNCKETERILKAAIDKSHGDYSDTEKAWLMRAAFDKVLGEPTVTTPQDKDGPERKAPLKG